MEKTAIQTNEITEYLNTCKPILTPPMIAKALGISSGTVRLLIRDGKIKSLTSPGGNLWILKDNFVNYLRENNLIE